MTKLISRDPIQRFKEGRKIVKAYDGTYLGIPVNKYQSTEGIKYGYRDPKTGKQNSVTADKLDTGRKYSTGTMRGMVYIGADGNMYQNGRRGQIRQEKKVEKKLVSTDDTKLGKSDKVAGRGTVTPVAKSTPTSFMGQGIQQGWRGTAGDISGVTEAQRQQLINSGRFTRDDFKDAGTLQTALNRELSGLKNGSGSSLGSISVDNKWGNQSQKALGAALSIFQGLPNKNDNTSILKQNSLATQMKPEVVAPKVVEATTPYHTIFDYTGSNNNVRNLGFNNYAGLQNFVRGNSDNQFARDLVQRFGNVDTWNQNNIENSLGVSGTYRRGAGGDYSDIMKSMASWAGDMNRKYDSWKQNALRFKPVTSPEATQMKSFKQGGLISRNPVKQFKSNFRKEAL